MFDLLANLLSFFYDINNSYVVAIVLLTLVVLVVSTPLTLKGTRSQLQMSLLQPELKAIQSKYEKDEREEMNKELMEFYQENNINPVGGCLPLLFQIPIFLVLYRVILGLTRRATNIGFQFGASTGNVADGSDLEAFQQQELNQFNPAFVSNESQLFNDLSSSNEMQGLGFDISRSASQAVGDGLVGALPYLILVLVVGASGFIQHRMIRQRQTGAPINPTQEQIMKIIPFFLPIFSFTLPAAIVFYFLVSNLYRIAQQAYITRQFYSGEDSLGAQVRRNREEGGDDKGSGNGKGPKNNGSGSGKGPKGKGSGGGNNGSKKSGGNNKKNGSGGGSTKTKAKPKTKVKAQSAAPGRNASGRSASARTQVEPKARKKKKR